MMSATGSRITLDQTLLALVADRLGLLLWQNAKNAQKPPSVLEQLQGKRTENDDITRFSSSDDFRETWKRLTGGENNG